MKIQKSWNKPIKTRGNKILHPEIAWMRHHELAMIQIPIIRYFFFKIILKFMSNLFPTKKEMSFHFLKLVQEFGNIAETGDKFEINFVREEKMPLMGKRHLGPKN